MTLEEFYAIIDAIQPDERGCMIWTRGKCHGYGHVRIKNNESRLVHRHSLERKLGRPIQEGMFALHHCDVSACCNPDHLYEGTHEDNMEDMVNRNRQAAGHKNPMYGKKGAIHPSFGKAGHWLGKRGHGTPMFGRKGQDHPAFGRRGEKHILSIPVVELLSGKVFAGAREAARILNLQQTLVTKVCKGKANHTCGYRFAYLDSHEGRESATYALKAKYFLMESQ